MPRISFSIRSALTVLAVFAVMSFVVSRFLPRDGPVVTMRLSKGYEPAHAIEVWKIDAPGDPASSPTSYGTQKEWFADLTQEVYASKAHAAPRDGVLVGQYIAGEPFKRHHLEWLILNGYPNANQHIVAEVALVHEATDEAGRWFRLVSVDDYWTVAHYRDIYDFVVHVHQDGTIRLMNPNHF